MRIAVCVKLVLDSSVPVEPAPDGQKVRDDDMVYVLNDADEAGLAFATRLVEGIDREGGFETEGPEIVALSVGPRETDVALRKALMMGAHRAIRLWDPSFEGSDSLATARILAKASEVLEADVVICGSKSTDRGSGIVGALVAEFRGCALVTEVVDFIFATVEGRPGKAVDEQSTEIAGGKSGTAADGWPGETGGLRLTLARALDKGDRQVIEAEPPVVLTVVEGAFQPAYASLECVIRAMSHEIRILDRTSLGLGLNEVGRNGSFPRKVRFCQPRPRPKRIFIPSSSLSAADRLKQMMTGGVSSKGGSFWEGTPEENARKLLELLESRGVIKGESRPIS